MTLEEIRKEIREYLERYDEDQNFAFISYSHRDAEFVYPKVLEWMRQGYNIYLDLDFEKRGSDTNWVSLMSDRLQRNTCSLAICFRSIHYYYSYASMIELLTMRSEKTTKWRQQHVLPIDVFNVANIINGSKKLPAEYAESYKEYFKKLSQDMGETFCANNPSEKTAIQEGLYSWINSMSEDDKKELGYEPTDLMEMLEGKYKKGAVDFYPVLFFIINKWFVKEDLTGNYKSMTADMTARFNEVEIYRYPPVGGPDAAAAVASAESALAEKPRPAEVKAAVTTKSESSKADPARGSSTSDGDEDEDDLSETVEIENVEDEEESGTEAGQEKKKPFSVTGDITYTLYGKTHTENQSNMMLRFFGQVLRRHQDKTLTLAEQPGMNCVSFTDYSNPENKTDAMPSYFRNCHFFSFPEGRSVCIGTAYSSGDKLKKMAMLLQICGESRDVFRSEQVQLPEVGVSYGGHGKSGLVSYEAYGKRFSSNQTDMLGTIISLTLERHPDKLDRAADLLTSVDLRDYRGIPRDQRSNYFNSFNAYTLNGRGYSVGGGFGMQEKLNQIARLLILCGEPLSAVVIEGYDLKAPGKHGKKDLGTDGSNGFDEYLDG